MLNKLFIFSKKSQHFLGSGLSGVVHTLKYKMYLYACDREWTEWKDSMGKGEREAGRNPERKRKPDCLENYILSLSLSL